MARLAPAPPRSRTIATRICCWIVARIFGREPRPYGIWAHAPRAVPAAFLLNACLETGRSPIDPALKKLVHLRVARLIGCVF